MLTVNAGDRYKSEIDDIIWMTEVIQSKIEIPICFDSPNPKVFEEGIKVHDDSWGKPLINSITAEKDRLEPILPIVKKYNVPVVALLMDENGHPQTDEEIIQISNKILANTDKLEIPRENIYFDSMLFPLSIDKDNGLNYLNSLKLIKSEHDDVNTICGLNNISHGLPAKDIINTAFTAICSALDQDAIFIELTEVTSAYFKALNLINGQDNYCKDYINEYRKNNLEIFKDKADEVNL